MSSATTWFARNATMAAGVARRGAGRAGRGTMQHARRHPLMVGGSVLGVGSLGYARHRSNKQYNNLMRTQGPGSNNPAF